jgi:hypothetical protein
MSPGHDDRFDAPLYTVRVFKEWMRREGLRQQFEGPFWVRALQALSFTMIAMVFYVMVIEVFPLSIRGGRVPIGVVFVVAGFLAVGLIIRGYLSDRARRFGGVWDGHFRILE